MRPIRTVASTTAAGPMPASTSVTTKLAASVAVLERWRPSRAHVTSAPDALGTARRSPHGNVDRSCSDRWHGTRACGRPSRRLSRCAGDLLVTAVNGSDLWRRTAYGFVHDNGHGLLGSFTEGAAMEVSFRLDFREQFDQAGVLVRAGPAHWVKAGVEISDGEAHVGAVATNEMSDWSLAAVPSWRDTTVTVRVSWRGDALVVRARSNDEPWQLVHVSPWVHDGPVGAGPYVAAPSRPGLLVTISGWTLGTADASLH